MDRREKFEGAVSGKGRKVTERKVKEAITEQSIELEPWLVQRL